ncbi:RNase HII [Alkalibacterium olivapovliticus]|uniref:Ribonuclease HII n=2 Tax=Alkalibacterium olivapovliticus TaxID=99907 RepID=A0A2T0WBV7_9LACT|nr:RNase HII [Alkalibacterium olivapovliticus]
MRDQKISEKKTQTVKQIREVLMAADTLERSLLKDLEQDQRAGVQSALKSWKLKKAKQAKLLEQFDVMQAYEKNARTKGKVMIAGVDEVGRGPLAGPVVSAAVILPEDAALVGINDSKQLSLKDREYWASKIKEQAIAIRYSIVSAEDIDRLNIYQATRLSMKQSVMNLSVQPDHVLIDAMHIDIPYSQEKIIKGDAKSISIAAASIIAKVIRDNLMKEYDELYPGYGFSKNAGYGTKEHLEGLKRLGPTPIHRKSFSPVSSYYIN